MPFDLGEFLGGIAEQIPWGDIVGGLFGQRSAGNIGDIIRGPGIIPQAPVVPVGMGDTVSPPAGVPGIIPPGGDPSTEGIFGVPGWLGGIPGEILGDITGWQRYAPNVPGMYVPYPGTGRAAMFMLLPNGKLTVAPPGCSPRGTCLYKLQIRDRCGNALQQARFVRHRPRRMNPLNFRALRRAQTREASFVRTVRRSLKGTGLKIGKTGFGGSCKRKRRCRR